MTNESTCKCTCLTFVSRAWWSRYVRLVHGPWSDPFSLRKGISICVEPCGMWKSASDSAFACDVPQIFQRRKSDANKQDFEIKLNLTYRARSTPIIMRILIKVFCSSGPYLVILAGTGDELSCGQAQNGVNFDFEGQGQSPPHNNRDLNQGLLHLWSKFGYPSLKGWRVIARTSKW